MLLFYAPDLRGDHHTLDEQESKHLIRVLRMKQGDIVNLTDGAGAMHSAELINEDPRQCQLRIIKTDQEYGRRNYRLHVAIAPTKNIRRFEWFLEKATEIGIDEVTPMLCRRSERREVKAGRLNKVITAAMKQSLKAYHPVLHNMTKMEEIVQSSTEARKFIAYVEEEGHPSLKSLYRNDGDAIVMVGPEGDFAPEEVAFAEKHGFRKVSLGPARLRTETAGVVAVHTIALMNIE